MNLTIDQIVVCTDILEIRAWT